jgi:hypothetical protein
MSAIVTCLNKKRNEQFIYSVTKFRTFLERTYK